MKNTDLKHGNNLYRACMSKKRYRTEAFAKEMAEKYSKKFNKLQYVYYCPYCFGYHLTSLPQKGLKDDTHI